MKPNYGQELVRCACIVATVKAQPTSITQTNYITSYNSLTNMNSMIVSVARRFSTYLLYRFVSEGFEDWLEQMGSYYNGAQSTTQVRYGVSQYRITLNVEVRDAHPIAVYPIGDSNIIKLLNTNPTFFKDYHKHTIFYSNGIIVVDDSFTEYDNLFKPYMLSRGDVVDEDILYGESRKRIGFKP